jgi:hypothetical protein
MDVMTRTRWIRRENVIKNASEVACKFLAFQPELYKGVQQQVLKKPGGHPAVACQIGDGIGRSG